MRHVPPKLQFRHVDVEAILRRIDDLPVSGRPISPQRAVSCVLCRRRIGAHGRLPSPGLFLCDHRDCETSRVSNVTEIFQGAYGRAISRSTLAVFAKILDLESGVSLVQRQPIVARARIFAEALQDLVRWQEAFDLWERFHHADAYEEGRTTYLPPRMLEDVLVIRAYGDPVPLDPTRDLPKDDGLEIRRVRRNGFQALTTPF
jgi:hypothetical protein